MKRSQDQRAEDQPANPGNAAANADPAAPHASPAAPDASELLLHTARFDVVRKSRTDNAGRVHAREVIQHPGAVVLLPVLADGRICLIRNYRVAVDAALIELPAGTLEVGEDPELAAARELAEETGYRAGEWHYATAFWMSPGILNERMHLYVARQLEQGERQLDAGEEIEVLPSTWDEILAMMQAGQIADAKTLAALLFVERFHPQWLAPAPQGRIE